MHLRRLALLLLLPLVLTACGGPAEPVWAPDEVVKRAAYVHDGPPSLTLFTVISTKNGFGGHSALMINADERILFDPAGTFRLPAAPERNDVIFGMSERVLDVYIDYHARETWKVRIQEIRVTPEQARAAARAAKAYGAVPKAQCTIAVSAVLRQVPGFESTRSTFFPNSLSRQFGRLAGVTEKVVTDDDADKNHNVLFVAAREMQGF